MLVADVKAETIIDGLVQLIGRGTAWKHAQQQNLGAWKACAQGRQNRLDACGSFLRGILTRTGVVGSDHHDHQLGGNPLDLPMIQPPRHVLGAITDESQIHGLAASKICVPHVVTLIVPPLGNGVSDQQQVNLTLVDARECVLMPGRPPGGVCWTGTTAASLRSRTYLKLSRATAIPMITTSMTRYLRR